MELIFFSILSEDGIQMEDSRPLGTYVLGREANCDIVLPSIGVSRRHVQVQVSEEAVEIEDLGSSAGTFVNDIQILEATIFELPVQMMLGHLTVTMYSQKRPLQPAEEATSGLFETRFVENEEELHVNLALDGDVCAPVPVGNMTDQTQHRLEMLYALPLQFAAEKDLNKLYSLIVTRVIELTPGAVRGALLIKDPYDGKLSLRASVSEEAPPISRTLIRRVAVEQKGFIWGDEESDHQNLSTSMAAIRIRTGMYAPLVWDGETVGVLFLDNPNRRSAFTQEDLQFLMSVAHYAASAVANQLLQNDIRQNNRTLQNLLANFSPKLRSRLLTKSREGKLQPGGEKSEVTILLSDLRGFTRTSALLDTQVVVDMLNDYFHVLGQEIFRHDGTIDKFIGDAILAVFGSPEADPLHALKAVRAAIEMQRRMAIVNERRKAEGLPYCELGVGVHTGQVLHGFIGAEERLEYTVIGDTVNKTSRYCDGAGPGEILLGPLTNQEVAGYFSITEKGVSAKHEGVLPAFSVDWQAHLAANAG